MKVNVKINKQIEFSKKSILMFKENLRHNSGAIVNIN